MQSTNELTLIMKEINKLKGDMDTKKIRDIIFISINAGMCYMAAESGMPKHLGINIMAEFYDSKDDKIEKIKWIVGAVNEMFEKDNNK